MAAARPGAGQRGGAGGAGSGGAVAILRRPARGAGGAAMGSQGSPVKSYDYLLKFLLVGDSDVGKGEILESLQDGAAESPYAYSNGALCVSSFHVSAGLSAGRWMPVAGRPLLCRAGCCSMAQSSFSSHQITYLPV
ncbi:ras-related protein Rab-40C isoform X1 [Piliocolobus tephrosceles]|uniref:ras-related protein Rab-40C isoform X1 n=1 Tax=Piliocolobus tephrosceles TaxID=591936 RepID=UPI000E6AFEB5|nr:ras-related protein Rab-40C isoform X1 [Piliocolobus tephrosceles]